MKEVIAVIRANMINQTKNALLEMGFPAFTACKALGRGKRSVDFQVIEALDKNGSLSENPELLPSISQGGRLIPKRYLSIVVPSERVKDLVDTIMKINRTKQPGDGKIFVLPVKNVFRVRTGETGMSALDEMAV
jgi:nitrogen regulatory protein PII 2